jgi:hypothetical protein
MISGPWREPARVGLLGLLVAYLAARVAVLAGGAVFTAYDTFSYAVRDDPAFDRGSLVSFTGHAPRLWGVPLFYAAFPDDWWRAAGQWALGTIAWAGLAWALWSVLRRPVARLLGAATVLFLALLDDVGNLDFVILTESLTVSLGVLSLAGLVRWLATGSRSALAVMTLATFWWTFTRPDIRVYTVFLLATLAGVIWRWPARRAGAVVAAGALVVAIAWCSVITPVASANFGRWGSTGLPQNEELFVSRLRIDVYPYPEIKAVFTDRLGMPACAAADDAATGEWDVVGFAEAYRTCPDLVAWGDAHMTTAFYEYARAAPGLYLRMTVDMVAVCLTGGTYAEVPAVIPEPIQRLAFPGRPWTLPVTFGLLALALVAALAVGGWHRHRLLIATAVGTAAACTLSVIAGVVAVGAFWRFGIQEAIGIRIAIIMLAAVAVDGWLARRASTATAASPATDGAQQPDDRTPRLSPTA